VSGVVLARSVSPLRAATYAASTSVDGLAIGTRAPRFSVMSATGIPVTLEDLTSAGNPVLLVFTSPECRTCREIENRLIRQHESCGTLTLAIASRGTVHANAGLAERLGASRVLLQHDHEVARAYGISRTPAAVLITAGAIVASAPAFDAAAIGALLDPAARDYMP
jgi:peroxiredoxin